MPRKRPKGLAPITVALTAYDIWRRLPPSQRRLVAALARKHSARLAKQAFASQQRRKRR